MTRRLTFLTLANPESTPHAEAVLSILEAEGWDITSVSTAGENSVARRTLPGHWRTRKISGRGLGREMSILREILRARFSSSDVICIHSQGLGYRAALLFLGPVFGKRLVYFNPDYYDPVRYPGRSFLEGILARRCHLHVNHEFHRAYILRAQYRMMCRILVVPPSLPLAWPIPPRSNELRGELAGAAGENAFILRLHGSFHPLRMVDELMQALAGLPERFRLVMTAPRGSSDSRGEEIVRSHLGHRVVLLPRMPYNEMLRYTVNCDAGVLLYRNNDLGNFFQSPGRLTEYLACGLPIVASRFTAIENLLFRDPIGVCVDSADPGDIARGIQCLENKIRRREITKQGVRAVFERRFALDHWRPRISRGFEKLLTSEPVERMTAPPEPWWPPEDPHAEPSTFQMREESYDANS